MTQRNLKILVTGADGMLGSNLVRTLLAENHEVSAFIFPGSGAKTLEGLPLKKYFGDITDSGSLDEAVKGKDVVVHAAASTSIWPAKSEKVCNININGTQNVIDKVLEHTISQLIFVGSASSLGNHFETPLVNGGSVRVHELDYIDSKHKAMQLVVDAARNKSLPATIVLPTFMIGAYDSKPGSGKLILTLAKGDLRFYTGGGKNFVNVKDVVELIRSIVLDKNSFGKTFVAGGRNLTFKEFFGLVAETIGKPAPRVKVPDWGVVFFGLISELVARISGKPPLISLPMARISCEKQFLDPGLLQGLNFESNSIENAIADCYQWFVDNRYL